MSTTINKSPEYKTILGDASLIDRKELPYVVLYKQNEEDGRTAVVCNAVVHDHGTLLEFTVALFETIGTAMTNDSPGMLEEMRTRGVTNRDTQIAAGAFAGFATALAEMGSEESKKYLCSMVGQAIVEMGMKGRSVEDLAKAAEAAKAAKAQGANFHD